MARLMRKLYASLLVININFPPIHPIYICLLYTSVFTFNFSPVISNNCKKRNVPYIAFVYDSPQVLLYSYTIINPCNYVFIFDKTQYTELKMAGINTVYYAPLAVNADRMKRMLDKTCLLYTSCGRYGEKGT